MKIQPQASTQRRPVLLAEVAQPVREACRDPSDLRRVRVAREHLADRVVEDASHGAVAEDVASQSAIALVGFGAKSKRPKIAARRHPGDRRENCPPVCCRVADRFRLHAAGARAIIDRGVDQEPAGVQASSRRSTRRRAMRSISSRSSSPSSPRSSTDGSPSNGSPTDHRAEIRTISDRCCPFRRASHRGAGAALRSRHPARVGRMLRSTAPFFDFAPAPAPAPRREPLPPGQPPPAIGMISIVRSEPTRRPGESGPPSAG